MNSRTHLVAADGHITKPPCLGKQVGGDYVPLQMQAKCYSSLSALQQRSLDELFISIEILVIIKTDSGLLERAFF